MSPRCHKQMETRHSSPGNRSNMRQEGRRGVTSEVTSDLRPHTHRSDKGSLKEGGTYTSLATARARSASDVPWNTKGCINHCLYTYIDKHIQQYSHTHIHVHMLGPKSGIEPFSLTQAVHCSVLCQRKKVDLESLYHVINVMVTFKHTKKNRNKIYSEHSDTYHLDSTINILL
jgi:hypothetical protein